MRDEFNADTWTEQDSAEFMTPPEPPIAARCKPVVASERDLRVQSALFFKLAAVAKAAEALHKAHERDIGVLGMAKHWLELEDALNEWRAA